MPKATKYSDLVGWQVNWMNQFAQSRQESNYKIEEEKYVNSQNRLRIEQLQRELHDEQIKYELLEERVKTNRQKIRKKYDEWKSAADTKIKKLKAKLLEYKLLYKQSKRVEIIQNSEETTAKIEEQDNDAVWEQDHMSTTTSSSTEPNNFVAKGKIDESTIQHRYENNRIPLCPHYIITEHSYALPEGPIHHTVLHQCGNCNYLTNKKSSYDAHIAEFCVNVPLKTIKCPICQKRFTYNGLRNHMNYYASGRYQPQHHHAKFSPADHRMFLDTLIASRTS